MLEEMIDCQQVRVVHVIYVRVKLHPSSGGVVSGIPLKIEKGKFEHCQILWHSQHCRHHRSCCQSCSVVRSRSQPSRLSAWKK